MGDSPQIDGHFNGENYDSAGFRYPIFRQTHVVWTKPKHDTCKTMTLTFWDDYELQK